VLHLLAEYSTHYGTPPHPTHRSRPTVVSAEDFEVERDSLQRMLDDFQVGGWGCWVGHVGGWWGVGRVGGRWVGVGG
jgi:hypothetical protein